MSKHWAIIALALWLLIAVAMNTALVSQEMSGRTIQADDVAQAFR
jgi:hypothetical protein